MRRAGNFFLWIVLLVVSLLITITIAQIVTQQSISRLRQGNIQATTTFTMNNRLQEMVNIAFELETKMLNGKPADLVSANRGIKDSLTRLQYNIGVLKKIWSDTVQVMALDKLVKFVNNQVDVSFGILTAIEKNNIPVQKTKTDSLQNSHWSDSIYSSAISFQKGLEQNLGATLSKNNKAAAQLSVLNRFLAIVSLLAIMVLATIIIRRQVKQLYLIKDLEKAQKIAVQSVVAKDQFLANMSHEIRTPLNAIKGFGKILLQTPLNAEQQKYSSIISSASENLLHIVNDILDFSKIEAGNLVLKQKSFSLTQLVNEIELLFTPQALEKKLKLFFSMDPGIPAFIKGDPERLRQIIVNLVSNAIKFTSEGKVSLYVKLLEDKSEKIITEFIISDTGVGIPYEKIGVIFERFEQLDDSFTRQQGGTGLGLAITKKLVEAMGGKINLKSEVNRGSVFAVDLEFEKINQTAKEQQSLPALDFQIVSLIDKRVLVAEDNKMNQLLITSILENCGVVVDIVENGEEALLAAKKNKYDLVLMDVQMPKVDGITATKNFRKDINTTTPIIAMTAHVLAGEREKCLDAGMSDYLSKPLDEEEVIEMLNKFISLSVEKEVTKTGMDQPEWLNMKYLNSICGNDQKRILLILKEFKKQLPLEIERLEKNMTEIEPLELKKLCHHLKSTLSLLSASSSPLLTLGELNNLLMKDNPSESQVRNLLNQLKSLLKTTINRLEKALQELQFSKI